MMVVSVVSVLIGFFIKSEWLMLLGAFFMLLAAANDIGDKP